MLLPPNDVEFKVGSEILNSTLYFLTDGIYSPTYKIFVQTLPAPTTEKESDYASFKKERESMWNECLGFYLKDLGF